MDKYGVNSGIGMRYLIDFKSGTDRKIIEAYFEALGCEILSEFDGVGMVFHVETKDVPPEHPDIEFLMPDNEETAIRLMNTITYDPPITETFPNIDDDEHWWKLAVVADVDFDAASTTYRRVGKDVRVYLLDSGITTDHPEFNGKKIKTLYSFTGDFTDTNGHGTALASLITGATCAITDADLRVVKIFEDGRTTLMSDIVAGLNAVAKDYLLDPSRPAVMNMSWVINQNDYVEAKIRTLHELGVVAVTSAGNQGGAVEDYCPARMPECITVGSFGKDLEPSNFSNYTGGSTTSFTAGATNYGEGLDLFAPGEMIYVADAKGGYGFAAGTSVAAAIETACVVVLIARMAAPYEYIEQPALEDAIRLSTLSDLLSLKGNYTHSPNLTAWARVRPLDEFKPAKYGVQWLLAEQGEKFSALVIDATAYETATVSNNPTWALLDHNFIVGTAARVISPTGVDTYEMQIEMTTKGVVHDRPFTLLVYDPAKIDATDTNALSDASGIVLQDCCGIGKFCCGTCGKTGTCIGATCIPTLKSCP